MNTASVKPTHSLPHDSCNRPGDHAAETVSRVGTLFRRHHASLCALAYRYVRSHAVAEELVQDVFLRMCRRVDVESPSPEAAGSDVVSYVFVAVRHAALNHVRRERIERRWRKGVMRDVRPHCQSDPYDDVCLRDLERAVDAAVEDLPARCRLIYRLTRQCSYAEVARSLAISPKTVENQVGIAIHALKRQLQGFVPVY